MSHRRRPHKRRPTLEAVAGPIAIRIGHRRSPTKHSEIQIYTSRDAARFAQIVEDQVSAHPKDPLVIAVNGYQPWLGDVLHSCLEDNWQDIAELDRAVQYVSKANDRGHRYRRLHHSLRYSTAAVVVTLQTSALS